VIRYQPDLHWICMPISVSNFLLSVSFYTIFPQFRVFTSGAVNVGYSRRFRSVFVQRKSHCDNRGDIFPARIPAACPPARPPVIDTRFRGQIETDYRARASLLRHGTNCTEWPPCHIAHSVRFSRLLDRYYSDIQSSPHTHTYSHVCGLD